MKRWLLVLAACSSSPAPKPKPAPAPAPKPVPAKQASVLDQAMHVFHSARSTEYTHKTTVDEDEGKFEFDCSGFVGYVLAKSQPTALAELRGATKRRPLAKDFVEFFQNLPAGSPWHKIERAQDLVPGDMIAWLKPDDVTTKNTGHVMIVRGAPVRDPDYTDVWAVPIIDSTAVPHGKGDSRKDTGVTGLGTGEVLLVVDEHDMPVGYRWSRGTKATLHKTTIALAGLRTQRTSTR
jgi:hypothetical protein